MKCLNLVLSVRSCDAEVKIKSMSNLKTGRKPANQLSPQTLLTHNLKEIFGVWHCNDLSVTVKLASRYPCIHSLFIITQVLPQTL